MSKAYVVHTGIITAIGNDTAACLLSLLEGKSGIGMAEILKTHWQDELPVAEVKLSNEELAGKTGVSPDWPRTALLSAVAVQEAWEPYKEKAKGLRTGFFSANTVGGMDLTENVYKDFITDVQSVALKQIINHECGAITEIVAAHFGIGDFVTTISTACSSSANSIMMAAQMIEAGMLDIAIAGGADSLSKFTLNGFHTLMILDKQPCQPFDNNRRGLNLGEGAGYVLLMSEKAMQQCGAQAICAVSGYANANDAYHQTASSPDGTGNKLAMGNALKKAGLKPADISYINLHGTGTANNDSSEGKAVEAIFEGRVPMASSTKAYTGHTLGAAGGVEAVFSALSIKEGVVFPNMRWQTQMEDINWQVETKLKTGQDISHVLSNSFGFGGNCSSLIFSSC
ncbi:MAG: beta-ketoacyl-[acyl-carrier-protein] synthase family protein [Taibaiella sp.]|nr:beta-ketoacyl-[acyl-carrier-protein] synthase family protein [Taibaiella sp.]